MRLRYCILVLSALFFHPFPCVIRGQGAADSAQGTNDDRLLQLMDRVWEWELDEDPLFATEVADPRGQNRLPSDRPEDRRRRVEKRQAFLDELKQIPVEQLSVGRRIDHEVLRRRLDDQLNEARFQTAQMPLTSRSGFHVFLPELADSMKLESAGDHANYIARLRDVPRYIAEQTELMRDGMREGRTTPAIVLRDLAEQLKSLIEVEPKQSVFFKPFQKPRPPRIDEAAWDQLGNDAATAIRESVAPALDTFRAFMQREYLPACRGTIGAANLPDGRDFYRYRVRHFTTLDLSPEEVHQIGLSEVRRIRQEMEACMRRTGFEGNLESFVAQLRTDQKHYAKTPDELLQFVALILKRMDGALPQAFSRLPRTPYGLREVPAFVAPQMTSAYYFPSAGDGSRAGYFYLNTYNLSARPKYEMEALSFHEAVPGHHLQIALQQELSDLHGFRRFAGFTAYVEGWALYSEWLGLELGFYTDPYQDFGRLSMEAWRACRLVVDTGMHALGWSRQQAIEFMAANTALTEHNIIAEVDRYIAWPGQALGYKMGQLKILELRRKAEAALGDRFDPRAFHEVVLTQGAIPLTLLEERVEAWIASQ